MKNIARKLSALLLVFVVSMAALCPAFAASASLPSLPSGQCVVDDANVLSSSTVQTITDLNAQLESSCSGAQIGVLTVDYTGSCTTEEYALQAAKAWGIGSSTGNNGVLILLVMETQQYADGDYYIATGDGFRNTTLESQASALAQTMEDDFVRQDYDDAVTTCARNVAQTIADIYGVSLSGGNTGNNNPYNEPPMRTTAVEEALEISCLALSPFCSRSFCCSSSCRWSCTPSPARWAACSGALAAPGIEDPVRRADAATRPRPRRAAPMAALAVPALTAAAARAALRRRAVPRPAALRPAAAASVVVPLAAAASAAWAAAASMAAAADAAVDANNITA